jgi:glutathione S-transferase
MSADPRGTLTVYGSSHSYYTGKLEAYLRYKEIPYRWVALSPRVQYRLRREVGTGQVPAVELPDGRMMTDTTPMIDWFEARYPDVPILPPDPLQAFVSRLLEDYADEWLWRPAMHFRWSYRPDALLLSRRIAEEVMTGIPAPPSLKRFYFRQRQRSFYVRRDGVSRSTRRHVEGVYFDSLDRLSAVFADRPFLLGNTPTLADFGFFASMFRHFAQDPTPAGLMQTRAPGVFEWQARLWNTRASHADRTLVFGIPEDFSPFLDDIGASYLPYLCANAEAFAAGERRHEFTIQGVRYRNLPTSRYRVWCLERLRAHYEALPDASRADARTLLERHACWDLLWRNQHIESRHDPAGEVPFRGRYVHYD